MKPPRYPRLTPLKAFELLRELDEHARELSSPNSLRWALDRARDALANHVRAAIVKAGRR